MLRILFLSKTHSPLGGVERWLTDLFTGLIGKGHDCHLGLAEGVRFHRSHVYRAAHPAIPSERIKIVEGQTGVPWGRRKALEALIRSSKPDIVVPVLLHEALGAASVRRSAGQKFKIVYPIHESEIWTYRAVVEYEDCIDATVSVNRLMCDAFSVFADWPDERNMHVRCGVKSPIYPVSQSLSNKEIQIGFCGKLSEIQKRASDLIEFCNALDVYKQPYRLSVAGSGPSEQTLRRELSDHIKNGRVRLLGWLSNDQLYHDFYPGLDALIITSEWETGPLVAWEAMMHRILVLTSEYRGLRREGVLRDLETSLVFPIGEPEQAAYKMCEFAADPKAFAELAQTGQGFAEQNLGIDRMIEDWSDAFELVIKLPERPGRRAGHYLPPSESIEYIEHYARWVLNRPVRHSNSQAEWPRYRYDSSLTVEDRQRFVDRLDKLERDITDRQFLQ